MLEMDKFNLIPSQEVSTGILIQDKSQQFKLQFLIAFWKALPNKDHHCHLHLDHLDQDLDLELQLERRAGESSLGTGWKSFTTLSIQRRCFKFVFVFVFVEVLH